MSGNGAEPDDDEDIKESLKHEVRWCFTELKNNPDHYTLKERLALIGTVSMYLTRDLKLQEADDEQQSGAGSAVRKYATAFRTTNVARGRAGNARSAKGRGAANTASADADSADLL